MLYNTGLASLYAMLFYAICRGLAISRFSLQAAREAHKEQLEEAAHYRIRVCGLLDLDVPSYPPTERLKLSYVGVKSSGYNYLGELPFRARQPSIFLLVNIRMAIIGGRARV